MNQNHFNLIEPLKLFSAVEGFEVISSLAFQLDLLARSFEAFSAIPTLVTLIR